VTVTVTFGIDKRRLLLPVNKKAYMDYRILQLEMTYACVKWSRHFKVIYKVTQGRLFQK